MKTPKVVHWRSNANAKRSNADAKTPKVAHWRSNADAKRPKNVKNCQSCRPFSNSSCPAIRSILLFG